MTTSAASSSRVDQLETALRNAAARADWHRRRIELLQATNAAFDRHRRELEDLLSDILGLAADAVGCDWNDLLHALETRRQIRLEEHELMRERVLVELGQLEIDLDRTEGT
ncbi:MAG: hypothetical protein U0R50_09160 [Gaiellales bacterium]